MTFDEFWEAGWKQNSLPGALNLAFEEIAKSAWEAATKAEREACWLECEKIMRKSDRWATGFYRLEQCINAIKARGTA